MLPGSIPGHSFLIIPQNFLSLTLPFCIIYSTQTNIGNATMLCTSTLIEKLAVSAKFEAKEQTEELFNEFPNDYPEFDNFNDFWNMHKDEVIKDYVDMLQIQDEILAILGLNKDEE